MPFMEWTSDYTVGVTDIDEEHKKLIALINELHDAVEAGSGHNILVKILEGLILYVSYHFSHEEGLYIRAGFPDYEQHKKEHERLTARVMDLQSKFNTAPDDNLAHEVLDFLKNWLYHHILISDRQFGVYINTQTVKLSS